LRGERVERVEIKVGERVYNPPSSHHNESIFLSTSLARPPHPTLVAAPFRLYSVGASGAYSRIDNDLVNSASSSHTENEKKINHGITN
jgi:hypothetical protein